jgi:MFS family permease
MIRTVILAAVFLAGAALMSLEMASFRLVQPEFGSDIVVWGSLISVFLGGLALGAWLGGRLADRGPAMWKLALVLAVAGVVTLTLPLYADAVLDWMYPGEGAPLPAEWDRAGGGAGGGAGGDQLAVYEPPDLRWPVLGAGLLLFAGPSILLGMVTPYSARLLIQSIPSLGRGVGQVSAVSTVGSILGTLATAFYLVAWMGTRWLLAANGLVLLGLGVMLALVHLAARRTVEKM